MINLFSLRRHSCRVGRASDHTVWSLLNFLILPSLSLREWERAHVNKVVSEQTKVKSDAASPFTTSLTFFWCLNQLKKHFLTDFFLSFLLLSFQISLSAYFAIKNPLNLYKKPIKKIVYVVKHETMKGNESVGRAMWYKTWGCDLRQSAEERARHRPGPASGETRRQNLLAIPLLLVPTGRTLPAQHVQPILG